MSKDKITFSVCFIKHRRVVVFFTDDSRYKTKQVFLQAKKKYKSAFFKINVSVARLIMHTMRKRRKQLLEAVCANNALLERLKRG